MALSVGIAACVVLAGMSSATTAGGLVHPPLHAILVGEGVEPERQARLREALEAEGVALAPDEDGARLLAELSAHGVRCSADAVDCLARLCVLADADRALRVWPADGALEVLVVDATPRSARARLRDRDPSRGWRAALAGALALAALDEPVSLPADSPPPPTAAVTIELPTRGMTWRGVAGAAAAGAGAVAIAGAGVLGAFALESMDESAGARFQDDAVREAGEANLNLGLGAAALSVGVIAAAAGAALLILDVMEDG